MPSRSGGSARQGGGNRHELRRLHGGEVELAERIREAYPSIERVRLVNSGTEATLSALRVARAATGRDHILKFEGCYHGHGDSLLVKAGSGVATLGLPDSPGVPRALAELTVTVPFNDFAALEEAFEVHRNQLAAVIVEPVVGNTGCMLPVDGFLRKLRALTHDQGTVLIFDEVMTGFRVAYGGAQQLYKIDPDMTTLGKSLAEGCPWARMEARRDTWIGWRRLVLSIRPERSLAIPWRWRQG